MEYLILLILLFVLEIGYFKVANKYNIVDKPNFRSAHSEVTLRGGGILFWFSALLYFVQHLQTNYLFFTGITIVSLVSFWDDIQSLSNKIRLSAHFLAITLILYDLKIFDMLPLWGILLAYIIPIGIINAYNFMDGINGITGMYTLVVMGSLAYVNAYIKSFVDMNFIIYPMLASVVFLYFNYRKKAKCFAGDIGSIAIAFWIIYLLSQLILSSGSLVWVLFLAVYGVETVSTIIHRLYLKQNIFEAHRYHFYQLLSNEYKIDHRIVSMMYAVLQAIIAALVVLLYDKITPVVIFSLNLLPLLLLYSVKFFLLKKNQMK